MKRKGFSQITAIVLVIGILASIISFFQYVGYRHNWYIPEYPTEALDNEVVYSINPETILASIGQSETDMFQPAPILSNEDIPPKWSAGSFSFDQNDLLMIIDALHQFVWKESLKDWKLIRASFLLDQCQDMSAGFDYASMFFYQHMKDDYGDKYLVHGLKVNLAAGEVSAGDRTFDYTGNWKSLDLDKVKIHSADLALSTAEEYGGRTSRLEIPECSRIDIFLAHERFEHSFLSRPFDRYDYGWDVTYWSNAANLIFEIVIDPYTGDYKILTTDQ